MKNQFALLISFIFFLLFSIWGLPETIVIRNLALFFGVFLSFLLIYTLNIKLNLHQKISFLILTALALWISSQLLFFSHDQGLQLKELTSIWKRAIIGFIFTLLFGAFIRSKFVSQDKNILCFWIIYLSLLTPSLFFLLKFFISNSYNIDSQSVPEFALLYYESHRFYLPKTTYIATAVPIFGISMGQILFNLRNSKFLKFETIFLFIGSGIALINLYLCESLFGVICCIVLSFIAMCCFLFQHFKYKIIIFLAVMTALVSSYVFIDAKSSWNYLYTNNKILHQIDINFYPNFKSDIKIMFDTKVITNWRENTSELPPNGLGNPINAKYYYRLVWAFEGAKMIFDNPLGYGLIHASFGKLIKERYPESPLTQSHSGLLDLILGIGIPGTILLLLLTASPLINPYSDETRWGSFSTWLLLSLLISWLCNELSQGVYFEQLLTLIGLLIGINRYAENPASSNKPSP